MGNFSRGLMLEEKGGGRQIKYSGSKSLNSTSLLLFSFGRKQTLSLTNLFKVTEIVNAGASMLFILSNHIVFSHNTDCWFVFKVGVRVGKRIQTSFETQTHHNIARTSSLRPPKWVPYSELGQFTMCLLNYGTQKLYSKLNILFVRKKCIHWITVNVCFFFLTSPKPLGTPESPVHNPVLSCNHCNL